MPGLRERAWEVLAPMLAPHPLIGANQNGPRPARPYASLDVRSLASARHLIRRAPDENGVALYREDGRATVEVMFHGEGSMDRARAFRQRLRAGAAVNRALARGLSVGPVLALNSVPELLNNDEYEERASFEFALLYAEEFEEAAGLIERVEIDCPGGHAHAVSAP